MTGSIRTLVRMLSKYVTFLCGIYWKKIPELSEHLWEKNMEQIAEGWFLDLQEFLEVWPSVKGGGKYKTPLAVYVSGLLVR